MIARPVYVAVIGWVLIVIGGLSLIVSGLIAASPDLAATLAPGPSPSFSSILLNLGASALELVCGIFILRGANWARWLYLVQSAASAIYLLFAGGVDSTMMILWLAFLAVTLGGLFTPAASRFFESGAADAADAPETGIPDPAEPEPLQP